MSGFVFEILFLKTLIQYLRFLFDLVFVSTPEFGFSNFFLQSLNPFSEGK